MKEPIDPLLRDALTGTETDSKVEELQERIDIIRHKLKYVESRPTVVCVEHMEPLMLAGNLIPGIINIAGSKNLLTEAGQPSPVVKWEDIQLADPEIMIVMSKGFSIERIMPGMESLLNLPGFAETRAVRNNRLYITDGELHFYRPGAQIVDSIEILAEIIHPKLFSFGYEGNGWVKFSLKNSLRSLFHLKIHIFGI